MPKVKPPDIQDVTFEPVTPAPKDTSRRVTDFREIDDAPEDVRDAEVVAEEYPANWYTDDYQAESVGFDWIDMETFAEETSAAAAKEARRKARQQSIRQHFEKKRLAGRGDYLEGVANDIESRMAAHLAQVQAPLQESVAWVETLVEALVNKKRYMSKFVLMRHMLMAIVILTLWLRVLYPLVQGIATVPVDTSNAIVDVIADGFTGDPFKGTRVESLIDFNSPQGVLKVTDTMRFRGTHPVTGQPSMHNGVDIGGSFQIFMPFAGTAKTRTPAETGGCGQVLLLLPKEGGHMVQVCHMKTIDVPDGEVKPGTLLGTTGADNGTPEAGTSTGPHAHVEVAKIDGQDWQGDREYTPPTINLIERFLKIKTPGAVAKPLPGDARVPTENEAPPEPEQTPEPQSTTEPETP